MVVLAANNSCMQFDNAVLSESVTQRQKSFFFFVRAAYQWYHNNRGLRSATLIGTWHPNPPALFTHSREETTF